MAPHLPVGEHLAVQDRYAGDVGDYYKLSVLRALAGQGATQRLAVLWYRTLPEDNGDGRHVDYLAMPAYQRCDPDLHTRLDEVVRSGQRSVGALETAGLLPGDTVFHSDVLDHGDAVGRVRRLARRREWFEGALEVSAGADVVFVDPDNGIRAVDHREGPARKKGPKYTYLDEVAEIAQRGQSIVAYHHHDRSGHRWSHAARRLADLSQVTGCAPIAAVVANAWGTRFFLVAAATDRHAIDLRDGLRAYDNESWPGEVRVLWAHED